MANKLTRIEIGSDGYAGIGQLLKSDGMREAVESAASGIAARAGSGYAYDAHLSSQRWNANVYPADPEAWEDQIENNTLLKVLR